jgi:Flp pilus assembly protein TadB
VAVLVVLTIVVVRAEDPGVRRDRLAVEAQLPHLVLLLAAALRAGAPVGGALRLALEALPGPAAQRLAPVLARLSLGVDPAEAWEPLRHDPAVAPLARAMVTSTRSGARVADAAERLADDLAAEGRARAESRARTVGVRAAVPLGLCLLPSFLLIGIVPVVAGLVGSILR